MRKMKFRGRALSTGKFVQGCLITDTNESKAFIGYLDNLEEVDKDTVGEYTGIKYNLVGEIFEGDILKIIPFTDEEFDPVDEYPEYNTVVEWNDGGFICIDKTGARSWDYASLSYVLEEADDFEIIGNIFDNPDIEHMPLMHDKK